MAENNLNIPLPQNQKAGPNITVLVTSECDPQYPPQVTLQVHYRNVPPGANTANTAGITAIDKLENQPTNNSVTSNANEGTSNSSYHNNNNDADNGRNILNNSGFHDSSNTNNTIANVENPFMTNSTTSNSNNQNTMSTPSTSNVISMPSFVIREDDYLCGCDERAVFRTVTSELRTKGLKFYKCGGDKCGFFKWLLKNGKIDQMCKCKPEAYVTVKKSTKNNSNYGRLFYGCPKVDQRYQCKYFDWVDMIVDDDSPNNIGNNNTRGGQTQGAIRNTRNRTTPYTK